MGLQWKTDDGQSKGQRLKRVVKPGDAIKINLKHRAKICKASVMLIAKPSTPKPPTQTKPSQTSIQADCRTGRGGIKVVNNGKRDWPAMSTVKWTTDNGQSGKRTIRRSVKRGDGIKVRLKKLAKMCRARVMAPTSGTNGTTTKPTLGKAVKAGCRTGGSGIKVLNTGKQTWTPGSKVSWKTGNGQRGQRVLRSAVKAGDGLKLRLKKPAKKCKAAVNIR
jgi:hypothetical protein